MAFPWSGCVLGDTVSVVGAEMPDSDRLGIFSFPGSARECNAPEALPRIARAESEYPWARQAELGCATKASLTIF